MTPNGGKMSEPAADKLTLGQVSVNRDAFDLDLRMNDGYQAYSAELLRLALLVLTGLSAVWLKVYLPEEHTRVVPLRMSILFLSAFASAALSAGAALLHRYASSDSLAYHLAALRHRARNRPAQGSKPSDVSLAEKEERHGNIRFKWSSRLLASSGALLFVGLLLFCLALASFMF
jgi:hypothetical protein